MKNLLPIQIEARNSLAKAARHLRSLRGTKAEKTLEWEENPRGDLVAKVSVKGKLILFKNSVFKGGVNYCSSFGPDSDRSFSGFLPCLNLEAAKKLVYFAASKHW